MRPLRQNLIIALTALTALAAFAHAGAQAQGAVVGILEGKATLVRQTSKLALAEGATLQNEDIVETAAASFVQVEFADGGRIGMGPQSRLMFAPRGPARGPRLYLLQGWVKWSQPADRPVPGDLMTPQFEIGPVSGATILMSSAQELAAFTETGSAKLTERGLARTALQLAAGDFVSARPGDKPTVVNRPAPEFLAQMPRPFRDPLPSRAAKFRDSVITLRPLGDVAYEDIAAWLSAEPGLRLPLVERWRPRLRDKAFRAAMIANLAAHPEWDPLVFPEKAAKKRADEKRARDAKAAAAAAAAASAAATSAARSPN